MSGRVVGVSDDGKMLAGFFLYTGGIGLFLIMVMARCFVISKMWGWYVAPFLSAPPMPMAVAYGFSLLLSYLVVRVDSKSDEKKFWQRACGALGIAAAVLSMGWLGTWFLP